MAEAYVELNKPAAPDPDSLIKTFPSVDDHGETTHSQAVTIVDGATGIEVQPVTNAQLRASPLVVTAADDGGGILVNGVRTAIADAAAPIAAANPARRGIIIQNVGQVTVYIGVAGVSVVTGIPLEPGQPVTFGPPLVPKNALFGIADAGASGLVLVTEVT